MPRKQKKYHYLYKTTNMVNGKFYVGMHSTDDLNDGYLGSGKYLWNSIKKHGRENFKVEFLEFFEDRKSLKEAEKKLVNTEFLQNTSCMNLKTGGEGFDSITGRKGRLITNKILHERFLNDFEYRERWRKAVSTGLKAKWKQDGHPWERKKHKQESKEKIGTANSEHQKGEKNSQYGTCWITKDDVNKKIKKEELKFWLNDGWLKGRK